MTCNDQCLRQKLKWLPKRRTKIQRRALLSPNPTRAVQTVCRRSLFLEGSSWLKAEREHWEVFLTGIAFHGPPLRIRELENNVNQRRTLGAEWRSASRLKVHHSCCKGALLPWKGWLYLIEAHLFARKAHSGAHHSLSLFTRRGSSPEIPDWHAGFRVVPYMVWPISENGLRDLAIVVHNLTRLDYAENVSFIIIKKGQGKVQGGHVSDTYVMHMYLMTMSECCSHLIKKQWRMQSAAQ